MSEACAIGVRLKKNFLGRVESLGREERLGRSTIIRILLEEGYEDYIKRKAAREYSEGRISLSKAAEKANTTVWEMEQYLVSKGFKSEYSIEDLKEELALLKSK